MTLEWSNTNAGIDWQELEELYRLAPLRGKTAATLRVTFEGSRYKWFVRYRGGLVAAGRALADGADCSYICDVAVRPSHQGTGLGKALVERLLQDSGTHKKIILYATPGTEGFYRRLGFMRLVTAMAVFQERDWAIRRGHLSEA
jgi:GNAT superfamily N-acetyltransferase